MADISRKFPTPHERLLLILKLAWCFLALILSAEVSEGLFYTLIALISFSAPVIAHSGIRWVWGGEVMPLWSIPLAFILIGLALQPVIHIHGRYDADDYMPGLVFGMAVAFCLFRYMQNCGYNGSQTLLDDIRSIAKFPRLAIQKAPQSIKNALCVSGIILLAGWTVDTFVEAYRPYPEGFQKEWNYQRAAEEAHAQKIFEELRARNEHQFYNSASFSGERAIRELKAEWKENKAQADEEWEDLPYSQKMKLSWKNWVARPAH